MGRTVSFDHMSIKQASFTLENQVLCTGKNKKIFFYDLTKSNSEFIKGFFGRNEKYFESFDIQRTSSNPLIAFSGFEGYIPLVSAKSKHLVGQLKTNSPAQCLTFDGHEQHLWSVGTDNILKYWDLRMQRCAIKTNDIGTMKTTAIAGSLNNDLLVTGSVIGMINLYYFEKSNLAITKNPLSTQNKMQQIFNKSFLNLNSSINTIRIAKDGQLLLFSSKTKSDSLRLMDLSSMTVFTNWPTSITPLGEVQSADLSPRSELLAIGNTSGKIIIYKICR